MKKKQKKNYLKQKKIKKILKQEIKVQENF